MTAAEQEWPEYVWPHTWQYHQQPHDRFSCERCLREADWVERHHPCDHLRWDWFRRDVGTPAVPRMVWFCGSCRAVMGPAFDGVGAT